MNSKFNVTSCQTLFQEHNSWKHRVSSRKSVIASRTCWTWDTKMSNLRKIYHYFQQGKNCTIWVSFYWKSTIINLIWCQRFSNWIEAWKGYDSNAQFSGLHAFIWSNRFVIWKLHGQNLYLHPTMTPFCNNLTCYWVECYRFYVP